MKYFNFNEDIILIEGACGGLIQDLKNKKIYSIDETSKVCLMKLLQGKTISEVINQAENIDKNKLLDYLKQLVDKKLGFYSKVWIKNETFEKCIYDKLDTVWLELRKSCNLKCCHCYMDSNPKRDSSMRLLNLNQWEEVILQLERFNPKRVILIGGEPLLFKDIVRLIDFIRNRNQQTDIILYSNLTLLTNEVIACIIKNNVKVVTSVYSRNKEIHDKITNHIGSFDKTIAGIRKLRSKGVYVQANTVIMKYNVEETKSIQEFLYGITGRKAKIDVVRDVGNEKSNLIPDLKGLKCGRVKIKPNFQGISKAEFIKNFSGNSCWQGKINIGCNGEISPCIMGECFINKKFNVRTHTIDEIINDFLKKDLWFISRDYIEVCNQCEYRYVCKDCRPISMVNGEVYERGNTCKYNPYERCWED
ncbi:MAG: radical SAM protein [Clostridium sp.]